MQFPGQHKRVLIDTCAWIYHLEQRPQFAAAVGRVMKTMEAGGFHGLSSELTLLELTVKPLQLGRQDVADDYELLLSYFPYFELEPFNRDVLLDAARLRARWRLRTPDAIQIATGVACGATLAVTNDEAWRNLPFIQTLMISDLAREGYS